MAAGVGDAIATLLCLNGTVRNSLMTFARSEEYSLVASFCGLLTILNGHCKLPFVWSSGILKLGGSNVVGFAAEGISLHKLISFECLNDLELVSLEAHGKSPGVMFGVSDDCDAMSAIAKNSHVLVVP